jgi:hypothetical protein
VICPIALAGGAKPLARRPPHNHVDVVRAKQICQIRRGEFGEVLFQNKRNIGKICFEDLNRFVIEVDGRKTLNPGAFQPEAETAASTKQVYAIDMAHLARSR